MQDAGDLQIPFRVRIGDETVIEIHAASGVGGRFRGAVRYACRPVGAVRFALGFDGLHASLQFPAPLIGDGCFLPSKDPES